MKDIPTGVFWTLAAFLFGILVAGAVYQQSIDRQKDYIIYQREYIKEQAEDRGFFAGVPAEQLHTMRVYEDGSYNIVYKDKTSETGCLPTGQCND